MIPILADEYLDPNLSFPSIISGVSDTLIKDPILTISNSTSVLGLLIICSLNSLKVYIP